MIVDKFRLLALARAQQAFHKKAVALEIIHLGHEAQTSNVQHSRLYFCERCLKTVC